VRVLAALVAVCLLAGFGGATGGKQTLYTVAGTSSCLAALPHSVSGLPPATPPKPPILFFQAGKQVLGTWYGRKSYTGIWLEFYASRAAARKAYDPSYSGRLIGNVIAGWTPAKPSKAVQETILGCLRSGSATPVKHRVPLATFVTFAGVWDGHTRTLSITAKGRGVESVSVGCCYWYYRLAFKIRSVTGTLTRATATVRVTSFKRHDKSVKPVQVGDFGRLRLRNGMVTDGLTKATFCSVAAQMACGA
jgi:hypothetical protein